MLGCIRIFCAGASSAVNSTRHRRESYAIHFPLGMPTTTRTRVVPDAEVRGAIALAFHVFLEAGSAYAVVHDPIRPAPAYALVRLSADRSTRFLFGKRCINRTWIAAHRFGDYTLLQTNVGSVARSSASCGSSWPAHSHSGAGAQGRHPVYCQLVAAQPKLQFRPAEPSVAGSNPSVLVRSYVDYGYAPQHEGLSTNRRVRQLCRGC
jgi:hypothetical protein